MMSMMTRSQNTLRVCIFVITVAALTLVFASAHPVQAAGIPNCNASGGATTPCFEKVWVNGDQVKMTFIDLNPHPSNPTDVNFFVLAPQTGTPQGSVPFFHDHVTDNTRPHGDRNVHYHSFLVFCSALGLSSGACVPTMTSTPAFAKTVNGQRLTSSERIESAVISGLLMLVDTGAVIVARIHPDK
jgi:hypothetical protein